MYTLHITIMMENYVYIEQCEKCLHSLHQYHLYISVSLMHCVMELKIFADITLSLIARYVFIIITENNHQINIQCAELPS